MFFSKALHGRLRTSCKMSVCPLNCIWSLCSVVSIHSYAQMLHIYIWCAGISRQNQRSNWNLSEERHFIKKWLLRISCERSGFELPAKYIEFWADYAAYSKSLVQWEFHLKQSLLCIWFDSTLFVLRRTCSNCLDNCKVLVIALQDLNVIITHRASERNFTRWYEDQYRAPLAYGSSTKLV